MLSISINNFQSIKQAKLSFTGYSCIVGRSDMGKSAVRRSIQTALFNQWSSSFTRVDSTRTTISLSHNNNTVSLNKPENSWVINNKQIPKLGRDKPDLPNYNQELNITTQLEPLFMVSYKDTENTRILNNLFGIDIIEEAQRLAQSDNRKLKEQIKIHQELIAEKEQEYQNTRKQLVHLKEKQTFLKEITDLKELLQSYILSTKDSSPLMLKLESVSNKAKVYQDSIKCIQDASLLNDYISTYKQKERLESQLNSLPDLSVFKGINTLIKGLKLYYHSLSLTDTYAKTSDSLYSVKQELSKYVCPTCGNKL